MKKRLVMNRKKKNTKQLLLILALTIFVGYALLNTTLLINGTADIIDNTWDIKWDKTSISVTNGSVTASTPDVTERDTKVSFAANLKVPGDYYEFTIDAVNAGTVDAMVDDIKTTVTDGNDQTTTLPDYIIFTVTYSDGTAIEPNHLLSKRVDENTPTREKYKVRVEFDSETETLPSTNATYKITYAVTYKQADSNASSRNPFADAGKGVYFDPVSSAQCDNTTYNQTAVNNGTSTCYKWHIISINGNNATLQLDHNLIDAEWAKTGNAYNALKTSSNSTSKPKVSKLDNVNKKVKVQKITDYYDYPVDNHEKCYDCHNDEGPFTAMQELTEATSTWTRVPLIGSFLYTPTMKYASRGEWVDEFTPLSIQNGVYQAGDNTKTRIENVRARMITPEEVNKILKAKGHTLSEYQGYNEIIANQQFNNTASFNMEDAPESVQWLFDNLGDGYWMMTQGYDVDAAWLVCGFAFQKEINPITNDYDKGIGIVTYFPTDRYVGVRPVVTVPKSSIVIVN